MVCALLLTASPSQKNAAASTVTLLGRTVAITPNPMTLTGGTPNVTVGFDIVLNFINTPTAGEAAAFAAAEASWESLVLGYQENVPTNTVTIDVNLAPIDGPGGILGSAGPTVGKDATSTFLYTDIGVMNFDTDDLPILEAAGVLDEVIQHEMGHVIGIGTLWSSAAAGIPGFQELYVNGSGQYTGAFGLASYNAEFDQAGAFVPVELGGGTGTADGHWNEVDGGAGPTGITSNITGQDFRDELMTGWLNAPTFLSTLTRDSLWDLGYNNVVPEPSSATLALISLLSLGLRRRR